MLKALFSAISLNAQSALGIALNARGALGRAQKPGTLDKAALTAAPPPLGAPARIDRPLSPVTIGQALKASEAGNFSDLMNLAILLEDRDPQWRAVLQTRKSAVVRLPLTVEAAGDEARAQQDADLARAILAGPGVRRLLFDLLDGISKGFSIVEIDWETARQPWRPRAYLFRDQRFFRQKPGAPGAIFWQTAAAEKLGLNPEAPLAAGKFIHHAPMLTSQAPALSGLCRLGIWLWTFKSFSLRDWLEFLEAFGQPMRIGKYPPSATEAERDILKVAVIELGRSAGVMIPQGMELAFEGGARAAEPDLHLKAIQYFDQQASKIVLGQTTTTDAISGGHAVAQEHNEVRGDIRDADAADLAETLERDLIRVAIDLNFGPPPNGRYPKIHIAAPERSDIALLSEALARLVPLGLEVEQSVIRDRLGLPDPPSGRPDLLLQPPPGAAAQARVAPRAGRALHARGAAASFSGRLEAGTGEQIDLWVEEIRDMLEAAEAAGASLEEARDDLLRLYDRLSVEEAAELIGQASLAAKLSGMV